MSHRTYFAHSRGFYFDSVISERLARCPVHRPSPEGVQKLWIRARDRVRSEISQLGFPATRVVAACVTVSAAATATAAAAAAATATTTTAAARSHTRDLTFPAGSPFHVHVSTRVCNSSAAVHRCNIEELHRRIIATDEFGRVVLCSVLLLQLIACVMPGSRSSTDPEHKSPRESGEDSEDESEILEESPCGRWLKRREEVYVGSKSTLAEGSTFGAARGSENEVTEMEVEQRDVPGIDCAYLAMDTEEGVEVVWNEVQFSERKNFKAQEEKIQLVFENLTQLEHPNIVKFHRYWTDTHNDKPRVIFITEYMSSGSLKQFLKRTKRNVKKLPLQAWKRWCTQILSALSYLHSCSPPIIHGNLTCDTIFIQHNGLVKIGSVAPDAIHHHVKTCRANMKNMHFVAPEYGNSVTPAIDIYSFGMCALEMAALEIQGNGDSGTIVTEENVGKTIESLDDVQQKDFIRKCLQVDPLSRPSARELLFHPVLFEVHSLKLLAAHALVNSATNISETITDEVLQRLYGPDTVVAEIKYQGRPAQQIRLSDIPVTEKLEKFVEDVKYGIYPLTAFIAKLPPPVRPRAISPEVTESVKSVTPEPVDVESRRVVNMMCNVKPREESCELLMTILLRMDDKMNRQLTCPVSQVDTSLLLAQELVHFGFINENDRDKIANLIEEALRSCFNKQMMTPGMVSLTNLPTQTTLLLPGPEFPCLQHFDNSMYNASTSNSDSVTNLLPKTSGLPVSSNTSKSHDEAEPPTNTESGS